MKPHHRASLLLGCLGLFVLYLPEGLRLVGDWPARPGLGSVPTLTLTPAASPAVGLIGPVLPVAGPSEASFPRPTGPEAPLMVDDLDPRERPEAFAGGQ